MPEHQFHWRTYWWLVWGFMIAVPVGTVLHESAHYLTAKVMGYEGYLSYRSTIYTFIPDAGNALMNKRILVTIAGPLQTMLTGLLGLAFLWYHRRSIQKSRQLNIRQWILIFLSFFWLRQVMNLFIWLISMILGGDHIKNSDEIKTSIYFGLPFWLITVVTGIIGCVLLAFVYLKFIPRLHKWVFPAALISGCAAGYFLWFGWLGKILLPVK